MRATRVLSWFLTLVVSASTAGAADYFVSPGGNDNNAGTAVDKPLKTIARAAGLARAGDTVRVAPGTYDGRTVLGNSGKENSPITIRGDGKGEVVWTTSAPDPEGWAEKYALNLSDRSHVVVEGITFRNCAAWILMSNSHHVTLRNCVFDGGRMYNLLRINNGSYNRILNCRFPSALKQTGVRKEAGWIPTPGADYIEIFRNSHHNLVDGCEFGAITHVAVDIEPHEKSTSPTFNIVRNCVFRNPEWKAVSVLRGSRHTLVENNLCEGSAALFVHVESERMILRRNFFLGYRDTTGGKPDITQRGTIRIGGGTMDCRFYHNLFYDNERTITSFNMGQPVPGNLWKNNIFFDNAQTVFLGFKEYQAGNRTPFLHNVLRGKAAGEKLIQLDKDLFTLTAAAEKFPELYRGNLDADPQFLDAAKQGFRLKDTSPCIDAGASLTVATKDGRGRVVPVDDPLYFCDGWELIDGDSVVVGDNPPARIVKVDYENKTLKLDRDITWKKDDAVSHPFSGKAPDIGPYESAGAGAGQTPVNPPSGKTLTALKPGDMVKLAGGEVVVRAFDVLPVIRDQFSERFTFDCFGEKSFEQLRKQEKLDDVVAPGQTEFARQVLLLDWAYRRIKHFGPPPKGVSRDGLSILKGVDAGQAFNCGYYAELLREALLSMGYVSRMIALKGAKSDGNGSEHDIVEVWSNQYRKWVVMDPTVNVCFLKGEMPLNAFEVRREWFYGDKGKSLIIVVGKEAEKHTTPDMPINRGTHAGFGTLTLNDRSLGKFLYVAYIPASNDGKRNYGTMFITKDGLCEGVTYHERICPQDPSAEPYWPMQQAALTLTPSAGTTILVKADTMTPDFAMFRHRIDGGVWVDGPPPAEWNLHKGGNTLEVRAVNRFGVEGAVSTVALQMK
ncbi:MAG: right-handed parallel beta-helix repeat-containing protein [Planctomycetes bacterium]|nr:right-handed parallel beta-helix repeat-containing protein [Planctomycetota bacterium]